MTLCDAEPQHRPWRKPMDGGPIRIAVVGVGAFAQEWILPAFKVTDNCTCPLVVSGSNRQQLNDEYEVLTYDEFESGVREDGYDAVYVTTPNDRHLEIATAAADLGKDILCEKPLEATLERARTLVAVCDEAGVTLMVGNRVQFKPTVRFVHRLLERGVIGELVHVHSSSSFDVLSQVEPDQWRLDPERGGGALLDIGVYPINTIRFLGETGLTPQSARKQYTSKIEQVEAHTQFNLSLDCGGNAVCTLSFAAHPESHVRLIGTDGVLHLEAAFRPVYAPTVHLSRGQQRRTLVRDRTNEYVEQLDYFAQCLLREEEPMSNGEEGLADMAVIDKLQSFFE